MELIVICIISALLSNVRISLRYLLISLGTMTIFYIKSSRKVEVVIMPNLYKFDILINNYYKHLKIKDKANAT